MLSSTPALSAFTASLQCQQSLPVEIALTFDNARRWSSWPNAREYKKGPTIYTLGHVCAPDSVNTTSSSLFTLGKRACAITTQTPFPTPLLAIELHQDTKIAVHRTHHRWPFSGGRPIAPESIEHAVHIGHDNMLQGTFVLHMQHITRAAMHIQPSLSIFVRTDSKGRGLASV